PALLLEVRRQEHEHLFPEEEGKKAGGDQRVERIDDALAEFVEVIEKAHPRPIVGRIRLLLDAEGAVISRSAVHRLGHVVSGSCSVPIGRPGERYEFCPLATVSGAAGDGSEAGSVDVAGVVVTALVRSSARISSSSVERS